MSLNNLKAFPAGTLVSFTSLTEIFYGIRVLEFPLDSSDFERSVCIPVLSKSRHGGYKVRNINIAHLIVIAKREA